MGRSKASKKKNKTSEMIVGSDIDSSDEETTQPPVADAEEEPEVEEKKVKKEKPLPKKMGGAKKGGKKGGDEAPAAAAAPAASEAKETETTPSADVGPVAVTKHGAVKVTYCPVCTFPAEMCEFSGMFDKCKPWLTENAEALEAEGLANAAEASEKGRKQKAPGEKKLTGEQVLLFASKSRGARRKQTTMCHGLEAFGFNLKEVAQMLKKKFQASCTVQDDCAGLPDAVEIQGDFVDELVEIFSGEKFNIPVKKMYMLGKANARSPIA